MDMTTPEGNKLIAGFMGKPDHIMPELLKYHTSWDWLMPVYSEIARVWFNLSPKKQKEVFDIKEALQNRLCLAEIHGVWDLSVAFIQWYNQISK